MRRHQDSTIPPRESGSIIRPPKQAAVSPAGFTLLELMAVILIFSLMVAVVTPTLSFSKRYRVKSEADKLSSLLRSARQYAIENNTHTRVAFSDETLDLVTDGRIPARRAYGAYTFFKPVLPAGSSDYKPFEGRNGYVAEFASMTFTSIPSGFVGQFRPLPRNENWRIVHRDVILDAFVPPDVQVDPKFDRDFFHERNAVGEDNSENAPRRSGNGQSAYVSRYFYNPAHFWDPEGNTYYLPNTPNATYPRNYYQTPYPRAYPLRSTVVMPDEPSNFEANGQTLAYDELWAPRTALEYYHEIEEFAGSWNKLGQPDTGTSSDRRFFDLKGIEFSPKGLPTFTWTDEIIFQFRLKTNRANLAYEVTLDRNTGLANVRKAVHNNRGNSSTDDEEE